MKRYIILITIACWSSAVSADDSLILKWAAFPRPICTYELYVKGDKFLYIAEDGSIDVNRSELIPFWVSGTTNLSELIASVKEMVTYQNKIEKEIKARRGLCNGFQWFADIKSNEYDVQSHGSCGKSESFKVLEELSIRLLSIKEKQLQVIGGAASSNCELTVNPKVG